MAVETTVPPRAARTPRRAPFEQSLPAAPSQVGVNGSLYRADLPGEDELPYSDGEPMESELHVLQMNLLIETLRYLWADRDDFFVGGNMFLYFDPEQIRRRKFRGPDVFVALGVPRRVRKSWVVWKEGKGPDVIVELLSDSTARTDRNKKKLVYQDEVQVPGYFYYHPDTGELSGFLLREGQYEPVEPDAEGRLACEPLGLMLARWKGSYQGTEAQWLRWTHPDGSLVLTVGEAERKRADAAQERADAERARADALAARLRELGVEP